MANTIVPLDGDVDLRAQNAEMVLTDIEGNIALMRSFSDDYVAYVKETRTKVDTLEQKTENSKLNQYRRAFKDYRQPENQEDMEQNIFWMVPVNQNDEFVEYDPNTGKPKPDQTTSDHEVAKYIIMYKDSAGLVFEHGQIDKQPDFDLFATLAGDNTFTGSNTFSQAVTLSNGATQELESIPDTEAVGGKVVKALDTRLKAAEAALPSKVTVSVSATAPDQGSMQPNILYFYNATTPVLP